MKTSKQIRKEFIDFFIKKQHEFVKSSSVVPTDDPTLLFTNAGMNQFKDIFLGLKDITYTRAVNSQKCIRAGGKHNDLEEVGRDGYHHTFFEMLGNWSFGDYYKKEAIEWAWELFTEVWKLPKDKLFATVHDSDDEAFELWKTCTDINPEHITYHGDKDNFWEMGETGPCGPCSEIHIDRGEEYCNLKGVEGHECKVNGDCHRYIELWNLVFMQFLRKKDKSLEPLKTTFVDTGAGFERVCQVLQNVGSNYDTDVFLPILNTIAELTGVEYSKCEKGVSHRVIADHIRALSFAIADGGLPSNEGRGYVLRRILRRAARHGRLLNQKQPFLHKIVDAVVENMGYHFTELAEKQEHIKIIIKSEEERFNQTLDRGIDKFNEFCKNSSQKLIDGKTAFMLYDTYGFPFDLTATMAEEIGFEVDETGFNNEMGKQKQRARNAQKFTLELENIDWIEFSKSNETEFVGYTQKTTECQILRYSIDDDNNVKLVLNKTVFYAEQGGQVADAGKIYCPEFEIEITDVKKVNGLYVHFGKLISGTISNAKLTAEIDQTLRQKIATNHTATHILHEALGKVLGKHVQQKGSLVTSKYLRFDYTHFEQPTQKQLNEVEKIANEEIRKCLPVNTSIKNIEDAKKAGAKALFGEKYGDEVRVISIGGFSVELCGGTHINNTGKIGSLVIASESSIAAGVRRIEAFTADEAINYHKTNENMLKLVFDKLTANPKNLEQKLEKFIAENKKYQKEIESLKQKLAGNVVDELINSKTEFNGINIVKGSVKGKHDLRKMADEIKNKLENVIAFIIANNEGKLNLMVAVSKNLVKQYHAGKIVGQLATILGGKGGGRPDMAMAGASNIEKIDKALKNFDEIIANS